jgi:alpha,alpha-trehalose phosphorylase
MDVSDVGGNVMHGAHVASIGGTWLALVYGFAGMRDHGGRISFRPRLPDEWTRLAFPLTIRGQRLQVDIQHPVTMYALIEGEQLTIEHEGREISLSTAAPVVTCPSPPPGAEPEPDFADDPMRCP